MTRLFLPTLVAAGAPTPVPEIRRLATIDRIGRHRLVESPDDADAIVFTEAHLFPDDFRRLRFRRHELCRRYPEKVLAYDETDRPWCWLPGIYVSMPAAYFRHDAQVAWKYSLLDPLTVPDRSRVPDLLFSFVGSAATHPCRSEVLALGGDPDSYVEDTTGFLFHDVSGNSGATRRLRYAEITGRSRYVLCPRGHGTATLRLFETLAAGRVPVIISDDWVPPDGPEWDHISIRWPESAIAQLPDALRERSDWADMARAAAQAHDQWFNEDVMFDQIASRCGDVVARANAVRAPLLDPAFRRFGAAHLAHRLRR